MLDTRQRLQMIIQDVGHLVVKGGVGSGNFGHSGRKGEVGGSSKDIISSSNELIYDATKYGRSKRFNIYRVDDWSDFTKDLQDDEIDNEKVTAIVTPNGNVYATLDSDAVHADITANADIRHLFDTSIRFRYQKGQITIDRSGTGIVGPADDEPRVKKVYWALDKLYQIGIPAETPVKIDLHSGRVVTTTVKSLAVKRLQDAILSIKYLPDFAAEYPQPISPVEIISADQDKKKKDAAAELAEQIRIALGFDENENPIVFEKHQPGKHNQKTHGGNDGSSIATSLAEKHKSKDGTIYYSNLLKDSYQNDSFWRSNLLLLKVGKKWYAKPAIQGTKNKISMHADLAADIGLSSDEFDKSVRLRLVKGSDEKLVVSSLSDHLGSTRSDDAYRNLKSALSGLEYFGLPKSMKVYIQDINNEEDDYSTTIGEKSLIEKYGTSSGAHKAWISRRRSLEDKLKMALQSRDAFTIAKLRNQIDAGDRVYREVQEIKHLAGLHDQQSHAGDDIVASNKNELAKAYKVLSEVENSEEDDSSSVVGLYLPTEDRLVFAPSGRSSVEHIVLAKNLLRQTDSSRMIAMRIALSSAGIYIYSTEKFKPGMSLFDIRSDLPPKGDVLSLATSLQSAGYKGKLLLDDGYGKLESFTTDQILEQDSRLDEVVKHYLAKEKLREEIKKHLPGRHNQLTHGRPSGIAKNKSLERARKMIGIVKKAGGVKAVRNTVGQGYKVGNYVYDDRKRFEDLGITFSDKDRILNTPYNRSVLSAFVSIERFYDGKKGSADELASRVKSWTAGKNDPGLDMMWAAAQLTLPENSVVLHRGLDVPDELITRIANGSIKLADVDTVGHWSDTYEVAHDFSEGKLMFIVNVPRESILYSYKINNFGYNDEHEIVPIINGKVEVRSTTIRTDSFKAPLLVADLVINQ